MTDHILDFSEKPARLNARNSLLVIRTEEDKETTVPFEEIAVVIVSNPGVTFTHAVLSEMAKAGVMFVACNEKHLPSAMLLPMEGNFVQAQRFALQASAPLPLRKRLWQDIVTAKVSAQARALKELRGDDSGLEMLSKQVRSGDTGNIEAHASQRYWPRVFGDAQFRRDRDGAKQNGLLNYGYAVLRAIVARAVCAAGLHPSFGLHHHNRYDAFCLADDLMEPFRPVVDRKVAAYSLERGADTPVDKDSKTALIGALTGSFTFQKESRSLFDIAARCANSLVDIFSGKGRKLLLPEL